MKDKKITLSTLLKADPFTQHNTIIFSAQDTQPVPIINGAKTFFNKYYYSYSNSNNNENNFLEVLSTNQKIPCNEIDDWISENVYDFEDSLFYIIGYGGCGKTTFVQNILWNIGNHLKVEHHKNAYNFHYYNIYVGYSFESDLDDGDLILKNIRNHLRKMIMGIFQDYNIDWQKNPIVLKLKEYSRTTPLEMLSVDFPDIIDLFTNNEELSLLNVENKDLFEKQIKATLNNLNMTDMILLTYMLHSTQCNLYPEQYGEQVYFCFDNLDKIRNFTSLRIFSQILREIITNIKVYRENCDFGFPPAKIFATYRKITFNYLNFDPVENNNFDEVQNHVPLTCIEISNLYSFEKIVQHRAAIMRESIDSIMAPSVEKCNELKEQLDTLIKIPDQLYEDLQYSDLLNHNYRACVNIISNILSNERFKNESNYLIAQENFKKQDLNFPPEVNNSNTAVFLNLICQILKTNGTWGSLGFDSPNKDTTLSRIILTFLNNKAMHDQGASIAEIYDLLCNEALFTYKEINACLCVMLSHSDSEEFWRRPLFFKLNAPDKYADVCEKLEYQYNKYKNGEECDYIELCISDEGKVFINKIVPHFEFYSVRKNQIPTPLYCIKELSTLKRILNSVYSKVEDCTKKQVAFMTKYIKASGNMVTAETTEQYLKLDIHPKTKNGDFQLHIVRVIYSHIAYINNYRDYVHDYVPFGQDNDDVVKLLLKYIGKYLSLYRDNFYDIYKSVQNANIRVKGIYNNVYDDLYELYKSNEEGRYRSIDRKQHISKAN